MEENAGGEASGQLVAGPGSVAPSAAHVDTYVASNLGVSQASDRAQEYAVPASAPAMYYGGMYPQGSAGMASVGMPSVSGGTMISGMSSGPHHHTAMMGNQMTQFATLVPVGAYAPGVQMYPAMYPAGSMQAQWGYPTPTGPGGAQAVSYAMMPGQSGPPRAPAAVAHSYSAGYPYNRASSASRPTGTGGGAFLEELDDPTVDARGIKRREGSVMPVQHDFICSVCEGEHNLIHCEGPCLRSFHRACIGISNVGTTTRFLCRECTQNQRTCFKCKIAGLPHDPNLRKCSSYTCGKFYHLACLKSLPLARTDGERIFCPLHFCKACWVNGRHQQPVRCSRCPNAYHTKCLPPSGVKKLMPRRVICPECVMKFGIDLRGSAAAKPRVLPKQQQQQNAAKPKEESTVVNENWVQCEGCKKWRLLPAHVNVALLPDQWYCSQNTWDPLRNHCSAPEQTTAEAEQPAAPAVDFKPRKQAKHGPVELITPSSAVVTGTVAGYTARASSAAAQADAKWVQCEAPKCGKWRVVPPHIDIKSLPPKWFCHMNTWDRIKADCNVPEDQWEPTSSSSGRGRRGPLPKSYPAANLTGAVQGMPASGIALAPTATAVPSKPGKKAAVNWVSCESCGKWRVVPHFINLDALQKQKWYCSMNTWDTRFASCSVPEESVDQPAPKPSAPKPPPWVLGSATIGSGGTTGEGGKVSYRDLIYGSWGGRAKSTSAHFGRGATARESHARFKDSTVYTVPSDEVAWLSQRKRKTADGSESPSDHSDDDNDEDNEHAPPEQDHDDVTLPPPLPPPPSSDEPLRMQMTPRELVDYFERVWTVFVSKSLNNWWTVYELTRQLQVGSPGVPSHVSAAPHLDPIAQFYPEMLMDLVQGIVDRLVGAGVLEVSKGLLIPRYRLSSSSSLAERSDSFTSLVSSLDAMKPWLLPIVLKSE